MVRRAWSRHRRMVTSGVVVVALVISAGATAAWPGPVAACSAAPVPFERVAEGAPRIFLVTVASRSMAGGVPASYSLVVREAIRGTLPGEVTLPTVVQVAAPVVSACGDVLDAAINTHLVLALDVPAFDTGPPMAVAFELRPDGSLVGGHLDEPVTFVDLAAFRAALDGAPVATSSPTAVVTSPAAPADEAPLASIGILAGVLVGIAAALGIVWMARRGSRPSSPPGPSGTAS